MGFVASWEDYLIHPDKWEDLYDSMPCECRNVVDNDEPAPIGIGKHPEWGWFIAISGQGPAVVWTENE